MDLQTNVRETLRKAPHPGQTAPHYSLTKYRLALEWSEVMLAKKANLNRRGLRFKAEVRHFCVVRVAPNGHPRVKTGHFCAECITLISGADNPVRRWMEIVWILKTPQLDAGTPITDVHSSGF